MGKLAALCVALAACIATPEERGLPAPVSGSSPLVGSFERAAERTGVPVELLATIAYTETRFRIVDDAAHGRTGAGIFGLDDAALAHGAALAGVTDQAARTDAEAGVLAGALLLAEAAPDAVTLDDYIAKLSPGLQGAVLRRSIDPDEARLDRVFDELRRTILLPVWVRLPESQRGLLGLRIE